MAKNIVEALNDKELVMEKGLVLNTSYDIFYLGEEISKYEKYVRLKNHYNNPCGFDSYNVEIHGYSILLWSENGHVEQICCYESCIYNGEELIMMTFKDFLSRIKEEPSNHDICYVPCKDNWGQNQHVYDFDKSGLQVWVWRGKIRSVVISTYDEETSL